MGMTSVINEYLSLLISEYLSLLINEYLSYKTYSIQDGVMNYNELRLIPGIHHKDLHQNL